MRTLLIVLGIGLLAIGLQGVAAEGQDKTPTAPKKTSTTESMKTVTERKAAVRSGWEYKTATAKEVRDLANNDLTAGLNRLGEDGWELVAVEPRSDTGRSLRDATYYFKRPKSVMAAAPEAPKPAAPRAEFKDEEFQTLQLKHVDAVGTAKTLQQLFGEQKGVRIVADPNTNTLLIRCSVEMFDTLRKVVIVLDSPTDGRGKKSP